MEIHVISAVFFFFFYFFIFGFVFLRPNLHDDAGSNFNGKNSNGSNRNLDEIRLKMIGNYYTIFNHFSIFFRQKSSNRYIVANNS